MRSPALHFAFLGFSVLGSLSAQDPPSRVPGGAPPAARPGVAGGAVTRAAAARPNFVFVQFEGTGAGWASASVAMDDRLPDAKGPAGLTPAIERLAAEGMRFSDFYVSAPRCTPARATFLTGIGAAKLGMTYVNEGGQERRGGEAGAGGGGQGGGRGGQGGGRNREAAAPTEQKLVPPSSRPEFPAGTQTIADVLGKAGYRSAHFGKWHVGRERPSQHGFAVDDGANTNQGPGRESKPNPEQALAITDRGLAFIDEQVAAKRPFYLQISHYGGGSEDESRPETRQRLAQQARGGRDKALWQTAVMAEVDGQLARLLEGLDQRGLAADTYVFVSFDHGMSGRNSNAPLSGGKGSVREGGVRVPFLVRGPGVDKSLCSHVRASGADLLPTIADLAGLKEWPKEVEGGSLAAVLRGKGKGAVARPREEFVVHFPHYDLGNGGPASAIWLDEHKLIRVDETGALELYDLAVDPGEQRNLASKEPKLVAELVAKLDAYLDAIGAARATPK